MWQEHNRHLHNTDDYKYLCDTCSRGFLHLGEFKAHRAKHTNIKLFTCGVCKNASFAVVSRLQKHIKTCGKEGNAECKTCVKLLSDIKLLNTHITEVHNDTLYTCKICEDRTYTSQGGYYRHMRSMHNIGRNGQKLRDVLKEISANATPKSTLEKTQNIHDDPDTSKQKCKKRKNTEPDPNPKKSKWQDTISKSTLEQIQYSHDDADTSKQKSEKRKNTEPDPNPKKTKRQDKTSNVVT